MATEKRNTEIVISTDPGFDSIKVTSENRCMFKIAKEVVDITDKGNLFLGEQDEDFIKISNLIKGKEHLVGVSAAKYLNETKLDENEGAEERALVSDTFATFESIENQVRIMAGIGMALIRLSNNDDNIISLKDIKSEDGVAVKEVVTTQANLHIGVALPHDAVEKEWGYINSWLKGNHTFTIETNGTRYNFNIETNNLYPASQVVVALLGAISDDEGKVNINEGFLTKDECPAIVIDGGYKTVGKFVFTSIQTVSDGESNQEYAMKNIHEKVAKIIQDEYYRPDVNSRMVKRAVEENAELNYLSPDHSKGGTINVKELVETELTNVCQQLLNELMDKYNNLLNIKSILFTGGTGAAYYGTFKKLLKENNITWLDGKVKLTEYKFLGKSISPEYAISVGLYKAIKQKIFCS